MKKRKKWVILLRRYQLASERFLVKILKRCGAYYHSADLFYQQLWYRQLSQIGFRVISVKKHPYHQLWEIRLFGTLSAESYLLLTKPVAKLHLSTRDLLLKQFQIEIQRIARDLGVPIRRQSIHVIRKGAYFRVIFLWPPGKPGLWIQPEKKAEAFSFLIRPWLRRNRN